MLIFNKGLKKYFCIFSKYPYFEKRINYIKKLKNLERLILYSETPILLYITAKPIRNYTKILDILIKKQTEKLLPEYEKKLELDDNKSLNRDYKEEKREYFLNYYEPEDMEKTQKVFGMKKLPCLFLFNNANIIDCKLISYGRRS